MKYCHMKTINNFFNQDIMLTCALIVWVVNPLNWDGNSIRSTFLTEIECKKKVINNLNYCLKIDKRYDFSEREWNNDNCSISEHKWLGNFE